MTLENTNRTADFLIKIVMLVSTVLVLLYFARVYNSLVFSILNLIFLIAVITKGITDFLIAKNGKRRN